MDQWILVKLKMTEVFYLTTLSIANINNQIDNSPSASSTTKIFKLTGLGSTLVFRCENPATCPWVVTRPLRYQLK